MSSAVPFLIWLLCIGVAALIIGIFIRNGGLEWSEKVKEGFRGSLVVTTCPNGSTSYVTSRGDTNCCDGDVVNKQCNGTNMCSLSPSIDGGLQSCSDWISQEWARRSAKFCTNSLRNYFGSITRDGSKPEGCSASICTADGSAPSDYNVPMCRIYASQGDDLSKPDSCTNIKALDSVVCPIPAATKDIVSNPKDPNGNTPPALLRCTYVPPNGSSKYMPVNCFDYNRYKLYIDNLSNLSADKIAALKSDFMNNASSNLAFCPASKAYYVDGTLQYPLGSCKPSSSPKYNSETQLCIDAVEKTGFIPRVDWGTTANENRNAKCDDLLCPYFKNKYGSYDAMPSKYAVEMAYCKTRG